MDPLHRGPEFQYSRYLGHGPNNPTAVLRALTWYYMGTYHVLAGSMTRALNIGCWGELEYVRQGLEGIPV